MEPEIKKDKPSHELETLDIEVDVSKTELPKNIEPKHPGVGTPKSPFSEFTLPCGYLDPSGRIHTRVELTELTGEDEDLMFSSVPSTKIVDGMLKNHMEKLGTLDKREAGEIVRDLTAGDRIYLIIALRRLSIGDNYKWWMQCSNCNEKSEITQDLADLEIQKMADPKVRVYDEVLPGSGKGVRWKVLNGHMENLRDKARNKVTKDRASFAILLRLDQLDGKPAEMPDVKKLSMKDRQYLRNMFDKKEGGIETSLELTCAHCGEEVKTELDITQRDFFFPSEISGN